METVSSTIPSQAQSIGSQPDLLTTMISVFWSPDQVFHTLQDKRWWLVPFLLCIASAVLFEFATSRYRMEDLKQDIKANASYSSEEVARRLGNIERQASSGVSLRQLAIGTSALAALHAVKLFGLALIVWLALQLHWARPSYMTIVSVCSFTFLITIPETILKGILIPLKGSARVFLGPATFLPSDWFGSPLHNALDRLDIFSTWMAILLITALPIVTRLSRKKSALLVSYLWIVWVLAGALLGNMVRIA